MRFLFPHLGSMSIALRLHVAKCYFMLFTIWLYWGALLGQSKSQVEIQGVVWHTLNYAEKYGQLANNITEWNDLCASGKAAFCYPDFDFTKAGQYGCLYNRFAVKALSNGISGHHVSQLADWQRLFSLVDPDYNSSQLPSSPQLSGSVQRLLSCLLMPNAPERCTGIQKAPDFQFRFYKYIEQGQWTAASDNRMAYWVMNGEKLYVAKFTGSMFDLIEPKDSPNSGYYIRIVKDRRPEAGYDNSTHSINESEVNYSILQNTKPGFLNVMLGQRHYKYCIKRNCLKWWLGKERENQILTMGAASVGIISFFTKSVIYRKYTASPEVRASLYRPANTLHKISMIAAGVYLTGVTLDIVIPLN